MLKLHFWLASADSGSFSKTGYAQLIYYLFSRTDQIERHVLPNGDQLDPDVFKVIEPKIYVLDDGNLFPFLHSTDIYPEWPVAALDHVTKDVSEA